MAGYAATFPGSLAPAAAAAPHAVYAQQQYAQQQKQPAAVVNFSATAGLAGWDQAPAVSQHLPLATQLASQQQQGQPPLQAAPPAGSAEVDELMELMGIS